MTLRLMILLGTSLRNTLSGNGQPRRNGENSPQRFGCQKLSRGVEFKDGIKQKKHAS